MGEPVDAVAALPTGEELAKSWEADSRPARRSGKVAAFLLLVLVVSLGVTGFVNKERVLDELRNMQSYLGGAKPQQPLPAKPLVAPAATVSMSSSSTPPVKPTETIIPDKEELVLPGAADKPPTAEAGKVADAAKPPAETTKPVEAAKTPAERNKTVPEPVKQEPAKPAPEPVKPVPAKPAPEPAKSEPAKPAPEPVKPVPAKQEPAKPPAKASDKPVDKATQADSPAWVETLDANAWVMQHGAFDSLSEARAFQATSLGFKSGQVLFTQRKGSKPYYILVTGPYVEKTQAEALMKQNAPLAKAWLRSAKSLKAQFQE